MVVEIGIEIETQRFDTDPDPDFDLDVTGWVSNAITLGWVAFFRDRRLCVLGQTGPSTSI